MRTTDPVDRRLLELVEDALASYRLTKLVKDDFITEPLREGVERHAGPPDKSKLSYLVRCPWCLSIYFGLGLTAARRWAPTSASMVSRALALSALTGLASQQFDD